MNNKGHSIKNKLLAQARKKKLDFNLLLIQFGLERILYRLSISEYSDRFLLKGAMLFYLWYTELKRSTRDLDLLAFTEADENQISKIFKNICSIEYADGIIFDPNSVRTEGIKKEDIYNGIRLHIAAKLDTAQLTIQIDIGFGDVVTPKPEIAHFPSILSELACPIIKTYPVYSVISEKFHTICQRGLINSRLKDYFDLYTILRTNDLKDELIFKAIKNTFVRRETKLLNCIPLGLTEKFSKDRNKQLQWMAFLKKNKLNQIELTEVVQMIAQKLQSVIKLA